MYIYIATVAYSNAVSPCGSTSTVQTRIQGARAVRYRLHCQTVAAPVWHGEGRVRPALQQEHHRHLPAPLPLSLG